MKKIISYSLFIIFSCFLVPVITNAEMTTYDKIIIDVPKETTTDDTIIITPPEELRPIDYVHQLQESGKMSDEFVERVMIDLTTVENGVVIVKHYSGIEQSETTKTINIQSKTLKEAKDIITRFSLSLSNRYQPNAYLLVSNSEDINISYVYSVGEQKIGAILNLYEGIEEALGKPPVKYGNDNDWVDKYNPVIVENKVKILTQAELEELKKEYQEVMTSFQEFMETNAIVKLIKEVLSI